MSKLYFVQPYDIFMPRGNSHWGVNSGDFGQISMLPPPSIFAGAFRSFIASQDANTLSSIMKGKKPENGQYASVLGSLEEPGSFKIDSVTICSKRNGYEPIFPLPSDVTVFEEDNIKDIKISKPVEMPPIIKQQNILPYIAVVRAPSKKPSSGYYLSRAGFKKYLNGESLDGNDLIKTSCLWKTEMRTGLALDPTTKSAKEGMLYTAEAISFCSDIGFLVEVTGADSLLPKHGTLSLGGDQRASEFTEVSVVIPEMNFDFIQKSKSFRVICSMPAIFENGWYPDWIEKKENGEYWLEGYNVKARMVCASVNGYKTVSGWNMVKNIPKTAMRTVPAGSVYWFDKFEGSIDNLKQLVKNGFWKDNPDKQRVVEGYNRAVLAAY